MLKKSTIKTLGMLFFVFAIALSSINQVQAGAEPDINHAGIIKKRPPLFSKYCWKTSRSVEGPSNVPKPFLSLPFAGMLTDNSWTSQFDHDKPVYKPDGIIAGFGETFSWKDGGTQVYVKGQRDPAYFKTSENYEKALAKGSVLAYEAPAMEFFIYYDGHDGHDFATTGNVLAAADGTVVFRDVDQSPLGRVVEIYHPEGYLTRYAHLASIDKAIEVGKTVKAGAVIGVVGGSAFITPKGGIGKLIEDYWGRHLHFSVFRWNASRNDWQVTDPFGWDPYSPAARQKDDPLVACNGEISYNLWVGGWPKPASSSAGVSSIEPKSDRYVGGFLGQEAAALDPKDAASVLANFVKMLSSKDASLVEPLVDGKGINYANYIEGGDPTSRSEFLNDLKARINSGPKCDGYIINSTVMTIWTSTWQPAWKMTELCYIGCQTFDTPWQSKVAGFLFDKSTGSWLLKAVILSPLKEWERMVGKQNLTACTIPPAAVSSTFSCSGGLPTRLKTGGYASVSTFPAQANNVRAKAGIQAKYLGNINPGKGMKLVEGPVCADGMIWWRVEALGSSVKGWTSEGDGKNYWLSPCSSAASCGK
jgi:murein DD-endopeptidase MepM/ murein hydrolase activator NlpD